MPTLLFLLLALRQAPADTATSRHWHLGESARAATDRLLARPGWALEKNTAGSRAFVSTNGRQRIVLSLRNGAVVQVTLAGPIGSALGPYVLKGSTRVDESHWQNAREHALITRSYTGELEVYRVEWVN